jgi:hypothetical protein
MDVVYVKSVANHVSPKNKQTNQKEKRKENRGRENHQNFIYEPNCIGDTLSRD